MAQYEDIYVRDNFGDSGVFPSTGNPYQSPDIIPLQGGTFTGAQAVSTYSGPDQGKPITTPAVNNIYVRAKNLQRSGSETGTAALYYSASSLLLAPSRWLQNQVQTAGSRVQAPFVNASGSQSLQPNEIALTSESFVLGGLPPLQGDHYCFIAVVTTPKTQIIPPTSFASNAAFAAWVQNQPAVAWRNMSTLPSGRQTVVKATAFSSENTGPAYFYFSITARGFPTGSSIAAQCTAQACPIEWKGVLPAPDTRGNQIVGFQNLVPGKFSSGLTLSVSPPSGQSFQPGSTLVLVYYQVPEGERDALELEVAKPALIASELDGSPQEPVEAMLIELGRVNFLIVPAP